MTRPAERRHDVRRHRPFDMDINSTLIGRANVTVRIGVNEVRAAPTMDGTPDVLAQRAEPHDITS